MQNSPTAINNSAGKGAGNRDQELVWFVGRFGVATTEQLMVATQAGRSVTYRRVARCREAGLLERVRVLGSDAGLLRATREGLRYAGLGLPVASVSAGGVEHSLRCVSVALRIAQRHGFDAILTERDIAFAETIEEKPVASARLGFLPNGKPRYHRADLAVQLGEEIVAIEVELTAKSPRRLEKIVAAWRQHSSVDRVHYLCEPGKTYRAVERAVAKTQILERADYAKSAEIEVIEGVREWNAGGCHG